MPSKKSKTRPGPGQEQDNTLAATAMQNQNGGERRPSDADSVYDTNMAAEGLSPPPVLFGRGDSSPVVPVAATLLNGNIELPLPLPSKNSPIQPGANAPR